MSLRESSNRAALATRVAPTVTVFGAASLFYGLYALVVGAPVQSAVASTVGVAALFVGLANLRW